MTINSVRETRVAVPAGGLGHPSIHLIYLYRFGIMTCGEGETMVKTINGLNKVFTDEVRGRVAVVTSRDMAMARLDPTIILRSHNMTVDTGSRIIAEIRYAFSIKERVGS